MKKLLVIIVLLLGCMVIQAQSFEKDQCRNRRVKKAKKEKEEVLQAYCDRVGVEYNKLTNIYIRAFKRERVLEVWAQGNFGESYKLIQTYEFCTSSGFLGPKRKQGDRQIPEGFYFISRFNPTSNYHLSLGINYPNPSDSELTTYDNLGGDIFIHGDCQSIGCIPVTDEKIKEVYMFAVKARNNGQRHIPVHIFPYKFDYYLDQEGYDDELLLFWQNLEGGYYYFESHRKPPLVYINKEGRYEYF